MEQPVVIPTDCTALHLGSNQIGDAGATALAEALKTNTALTPLTLTSNQIENCPAFSVETFYCSAAAASALCINTAIMTVCTVAFFLCSL